MIFLLPKMKKIQFVKIITLCFERRNLFYQIFKDNDNFADYYSFLHDAISVASLSLLTKFSEAYFHFLIDEEFHINKPEIIQNFIDTCIYRRPFFP